MNLREFCDSVVSGDLTDEAILKKWQYFCNHLQMMDVDAVSEFIHEGFLDQFIDYEANDGFGTEGLKL